MRILHISADHPDPLVSAKTRAVQALLALTPEHEHRVWSLNRVGWRRGISALSFDRGNRALAYGAPPGGLWLAERLRRVSDFILEDVAATGFQPDAIHAHKLSVEGLVGDAVARALDLPLMVSIQGDSDLKILGVRRDLLPRWRRIWRDAAVVFPFAPWARDRLEALLGPRAGMTRLLPCPLGSERMLPPVLSCDAVIRSAFHLGSYKRKNAFALMRAAATVARAIPALRLEIAGGGDAAAFALLSEAARRIDPACVALVGPRSAAEIPDFFNAAACMALPSRRESFGMVFVEALMAGCPVLSPKGWAIDGYIEDGEVGLTAPATDETAIAAALERLVREEVAFKARLQRFQEMGGLDRFRREAIAATYREGLDEAVRRPDAPPTQFWSIG